MTVPFPWLLLIVTISSSVITVEFTTGEETLMKPANLRLTTAAFLLFSYSGIVLRAPDDDARITTIVGLTNIQEIGSTQNINDVNGKAIMANPNPYKVVVVPE